MLRRQAIRQLFEGRTREAMQHGTDTAGYRNGCVKFLREFHETMGVDFAPGRGLGKPGFFLGQDGRPARRQNAARADEVSIRELAEAIQGHEFVREYYDPAGGFDFGNAMHLTEAALDPTAFLNINVFNLSVAGLVNAEIMERFAVAEYIGDRICTTKPTNMNGQKLIGVAAQGTQTATAKNRKPGEQHTEVGFGEMYQTTPETTEQALKCKVTKEAVFFDLTGDVLTVAGEIGTDLGYGREKSIIDGVIGVTNTYNFGGTSYNTYQTSSPWINSQVNAFSDWQDIDDSRQLFIARTDPVTGKEIMVDGRTVIVQPQKEWVWRHTLSLGNVYRNTQFGASQYPSVQGVGNSPLSNYTGIDIITSQILYNRAIASDGLSLSAANAKETWWHGDFKKAFWWMENWPLTPWQANASELVMKDQGLVAVFGANYRGTFYAREPRYVNVNLNA